MTFTIASVCGPGSAGPSIPHDKHISVAYLDNSSNRRSPCQCYQKILEDSDSEIIVYVHDDVTIHDYDWLDRVLEVFAVRDECAVVGLGGAMRLGSRDLYRKPYRIELMAREGYVSNQTDWQTHGGHETGTKRVAVVDAFFMTVRRRFLRECGGWPVRQLTHHCLDLWLACEAARREEEVWMVGASVTHHGGGTSTKDTYRDAKWLQGGSIERDHQMPHRYLYDSYADVLPIDVEDGR